MQLLNSSARYGAVLQAVHWLTALLVVCGWLIGEFNDYLPKGSARAFGLLVHMTIGQCVIVLLVARLAWRIADPPPPAEPTRFGRLLEVAAKLNHYALYALLIAVPIAGIVVQFSRGRPLPLFGLEDIVSPWVLDRAFARTMLRVHEYLADTLLILAGIHAAAALIHHYLWRDRTLTRMLPGKA